MNKAALLLGILFIQYNSAVEYNKKQLNANTDFLLHEAGGPINGPKNNIQNPSLTQSFGSMTYGNQNGGKRDYDSQFPALGVPDTPKSTTTIAGNPNNHASQQNPQSNGKRDYVAAPQLPTLQPITPKTTTTVIPNNKNSAPQRNPQQSNGLRDFVAPQYPGLKPVQNNQPAQNNMPIANNQPSIGKVNDLVNFYNNKNPNQGSPSYSNIVKTPTNNNGPSSSTTFTQSRPTTPTQPTKPMSFSSAVVGTNKPTVAVTPTTAKPSTRVPSTTGSRPGTPVLPSSIVNNNRGSNTNNGNTVTDAELITLSEELLRKDTNNAARYITLNYQEKTTSHSKADKAPTPLLVVSPEAWNIPTIQKFVPLLDNYERDATVNEHVTAQERIEENNFMDAVMSTTVMRHLMTFLKNKGYVSPDPKVQRDFVKQIWFTLYSRGKGKIGSSGFEHVFLSELKNDDVLGFHNWIYFSREEAANRLNYLGYMKYVELNDKGAVLKYHFNEQGVDKPVNTMFIGTSPELEMALYTLCYVTRVGDDCKLKLATKDVNVVTYNYRYRSKNLIGSAFPQI